MQRIVYTLCFLVSLSYTALQSQSVTVGETLHWYEVIETHNQSTILYRIEEGGVSNLDPSLPVYGGRIKVSGASEGRFTFTNTQFEAIDLKSDPNDLIGNDIKVSVLSEQDGREHYLRYFFIPVRQKGGGFERLVEFSAVIRVTPQTSMPQFRSSGFKNTSILSQGTNFKLSVEEAGVYKLSYEFLTGELGLDPNAFTPQEIRLFGNGGGMLPQEVSTERIDDYEELAIAFFGNGDARLDQGEYFLFYAEGRDAWSFDTVAGIFKMEKNIYDLKNHYILQTGTGNGLRIGMQNSSGSAEFSTDRFLDYRQYEEDLVNLLGKYQIPGSGKRWFGDEFSGVREKDYNGIFIFPDILEGSEIRFEAVFAARAGTSSQFLFSLNGQTFSKSFGSVNLGNVEALYASPGGINDVVIADRESQEITVEYPQVGGPSSGWLDYIRMNVWRKLRFSGQTMRFSDPTSLEYSYGTYLIENQNPDKVVWDITDPRLPLRQQYQQMGQQSRFTVNTDHQLKHFVAFLPTSITNEPEFTGEVDNQNLHSIQEADMCIIYHPDFTEAAERLADHRTNHSQLNVMTATIDQVMNEFAGGSTDPTGIRELARMLFERSQNFRYLLLVGDGSYDIRGVLQNVENDNFIPVYESGESLHPIYAFPTDDYYALLSPGEGATLKGAIDISVGRLPVGSALEANDVVNKIIHYETDNRTLGDWRLRLGFVADDEDSNTHMGQSDGIAKNVDTAHAQFNLQKIYLDAYTQESTPGGDRYPSANASINNNIYKGMLILNYLGHGGYNGWSQERVLRVADVQSWDNMDKLPLVITATCSFTTYDEPSLVSAGEQTLLNPKGGAVALFTTVRAVFSSSNERLTKSVYEFLFDQPQGEYHAIGDIIRLAKNNTNEDTTNINARKFALIGDPAMILALPEYVIVPTHLNGEMIHVNAPDTIRALEKVSVAGEVRDKNGILLSNFNGKLFSTIYDKKRTEYTLANDQGSLVQGFQTQTQVIFKGTASVTNGKFTFEFVVPKDINFEYGAGKMSFYATDEISQDAAGVLEDFIIGGADAGGISDMEGPLIQIFMNTEDFVFGGITDPEPTLLVTLHDESGINIVGNSIGHDLEGILDSDSKNSIVLNEFYEATLDDYSSGEVRYPMQELETGRHHLKVTAWDIANNFSEAYTEFIVVEDEESALEHVLNYPNPFTTSTNFQFEHNMPGLPMDVHVQIFTVSGRLVKTISMYDMLNDGYRVADIHWDGRDEYGDQLARGVYLYRVKLIAHAPDGSRRNAESKFEKLVLLK